MTEKTDYRKGEERSPYRFSPEAHAFGFHIFTTDHDELLLGMRGQIIVYSAS